MRASKTIVIVIARHLIGCRPVAARSSEQRRRAVVPATYMLLNPRFGSLFTSGVCPPSNWGPGFAAPPLRAFWPLVPRPHVLPLPDPTPRPTRVFCDWKMDMTEE